MCFPKEGHPGRRSPLVLKLLSTPDPVEASWASKPFVQRDGELSFPPFGPSEKLACSGVGNEAVSLVVLPLVPFGQGAQGLLCLCVSLFIKIMCHPSHYQAILGTELARASCFNQPPLVLPLIPQTAWQPRIQPADLT